MAFPPVAFNVTIDGKRYQELHVDGGITAHAFAYPAGIDLPAIERAVGLSPEKTMWVVRNTKLEADHEATGDSLADIAARAIFTMTKYQGRGDIARIERLAQRDGFTFRLAAVPQDFHMRYDAPFESSYMRALYDRGYRDARDGMAWRDRFSEGRDKS